ncbi:MAG: diacylglycerol kinase family lipid kinase [Flavobacteriia bacterium]|nr:diacylglycerol kinase family lipid kinase [Flavobacteriia bacterium]
MKKSIYFIINPISGIENKDKVPLFIKQFIDKELFNYDIFFTEYPKHAIEISKKAISKKIDIVCAVGGDGSVHEIASSLVFSDTALAIIPLGSGNGLARHLNIPLEIEKSIQLINQNLSIQMDTVQMNEKLIIGTAGFGFDALIAEKFNQSEKRGFWRYVKIVFKEFFQYQPSSFKIIFDNTEIEDTFLMCCVANSSEFGNGFCISPHSIVDDGKFEICLIKPISKMTLFPTIRKFFNKTIDQSQSYSCFSTQEACIYRKEKRIHIDGEAMEMNSIINLKILPKSLKVLIEKK